MCGRFTHLFTWKQLHRLMGLVTAAPGTPDQLPLRFNVAPSQHAPVVLADPATGGRLMHMLEWGLVPAWAKTTDTGTPDARRPINARSETVAESPLFRGPLRTRRCVVPVSGFYEWQSRGEKRPKQPWYIMPATDDVFAFAAVWDEWRPRSSGGSEGAVASSPLRTFTILTTTANGAMKPLHDRMPVMLTTHGVDQWLDPKLNDPAQLAPLFAPFPDDALRTHRVATWVNSPSHDDPKCIEECAELEIPELPQAPIRRARKPEAPGLFGAA